jgi:hypothetical protein
MNVDPAQLKKTDSNDHSAAGGLIHTRYTIDKYKRAFAPNFTMKGNRFQKQLNIIATSTACYLKGCDYSFFSAIT